MVLTVDSKDLKQTGALRRFVLLVYCFVSNAFYIKYRGFNMRLSLTLSDPFDRISPSVQGLQATCIYTLILERCSGTAAVSRTARRRLAVQNRNVYMDHSFLSLRRVLRVDAYAADTGNSIEVCRRPPAPPATATARQARQAAMLGFADNRDFTHSSGYLAMGGFRGIPWYSQEYPTFLALL
jgi:hypothetical protein